ncbi:MAG TPA: glutathione S-transferase N-terminal domain-containing protein [Polyangiaceae bacterium]|nr:glutathione S-transferase N-terminal domain-containing protein [Polyangiaceae bacterium]
MKLYGHPLSPCTRKVLITLAEKGQEAQFESVDLLAGAHKHPSHVERHPFGVIPVLDDGGWLLYESRAIIRHLDRRDGAPSLVPSALTEQALMDQWLSVDQSFVAPHTRTLAIERVLKRHAGQAPDATLEEQSEAALGVAFGVLDRALAERRYLTGDTFSLADVSLMPYVASLTLLGASHLLEPRPHLSSWWERVRARPSWRALS